MLVCHFICEALRSCSPELGILKSFSTDRNISVTIAISYTSVEKGEDSRKRHFQNYKAIQNDGDPIAVEQWATTLSHASEKDPAIALIHRAIEVAPYQAIFFETPPVTSATISSQPFEFVLMDARELHEMASEQGADSSAFATPLLTANISADNGAVFPNLGGDAILIAPKPIAEDNNCYSHVASFVGTAPANQVAELCMEHGSERLSQTHCK